MTNEDEREDQGWREAELYADDHEPSKRSETADDFMAGWRAADRTRPAEAVGAASDPRMAAIVDYLNGKKVSGNAYVAAPLSDAMRAVLGIDS